MKEDIDSAKTDAIILSHGHYDHTDGLHSVLNGEKTIDAVIGGIAKEQLVIGLPYKVALHICVSNS